MYKEQRQLVNCQICQKQYRLNYALSGELVSPAVIEVIRKDHPDWKMDGYICLKDMNHYRAEYVRDILETEKGELSNIEEAVLKSINEQEMLSTNINTEFDRELSIGEKMADKIAEFGGSWGFIIMFLLIIAVWVIMNGIVFITRAFDPYPFILLNLILSCIAALQAPIIMMSQNRQEDKDRMRSEHDYLVNLKAEIEIRSLHEKMDHLLMHQWQRLLEIQKVQLELMREIAEKRK